VLERSPQREWVARRDDDPRLPVDDQVAEAADVRRDHRAGVCHRLEAGDAETFAPGRARDDGGSRVQRLELGGGKETSRLPDLAAERTISCHDELHCCGRGDELEHALLGRETTGVENLRRVGFFTDVGRQLNPARNHANLTSAECASGVGEVVRGRDHQSRVP
jgi:hypothetical protein